MSRYKNEIVRYKGQWRAFVYSPTAAGLLNRRLKQYSVDVGLWGQHDEGIFNFADEDLSFVRATLEKFGGLEQDELEGADKVSGT